MAKNFTIKKRLSLDFLGEGWEQCYINFSPFKHADIKRMSSFKSFKVEAGQELTEEQQKQVSQGMDTITDILKEHFIDGKGIADGQEVALEAADLVDLPMEVTNAAVRLLTPQPDPKQ